MNKSGEEWGWGAVAVIVFCLCVAMSSLYAFFTRV